MKEYGLNELRSMFLEFFESKGHLRMDSFSLIPHNDKSLLSDSVETALKLTEGLILYKTDTEEKLFSENYACPDCGISMSKPEPRRN